MRRQYVAPRILETRQLLSCHREQLEASAVGFEAAALAGIHSIDHSGAYNFGIRSTGALDGLCFPYWDIAEGRFSSRFVRVKPDITIANRKYLQPVGERPRLYFPAGTSQPELTNITLPVFLVEGEKKTLSVALALRSLDSPGLVVGLGGVWSWRWSPMEVQPDGKLGKGRSRPIADLDLIAWNRRVIFLIFDSDVVANAEVSAAETALARELHKRGASVHLVRIPGGALCQRSELTT